MQMRSLSHFGALDSCTRCAPGFEALSGFGALGATTSQIKSLQQAMNGLSNLLGNHRYSSNANGSLAGMNGFFTFRAIVRMFRDFWKKPGVDFKGIKRKFLDLPIVKQLFEHVLLKEEIGFGIRVDGVLEALYVGGNISNTVSQIASAVGVSIPSRRLDEDFRSFTRSVAGVAGPAANKVVKLIQLGMNVKDIKDVKVTEFEPPKSTPLPAFQFKAVKLLPLKTLPQAQPQAAKNTTLIIGAGAVAAALLLL